MNEPSTSNHTPVSINKATKKRIEEVRELAMVKMGLSKLSISDFLEVAVNHYQETAL